MKEINDVNSSLNSIKEKYISICDERLTLLKKIFPEKDVCAGLFYDALNKASKGILTSEELFLLSTFAGKFVTFRNMSGENGWILNNVIDLGGMVSTLNHINILAKK